MEKIVKITYVANDGTEFVHKEECLKYEKMCTTYKKKTGKKREVLIAAREVGRKL